VLVGGMPLWCVQSKEGSDSSPGRVVTEGEMTVEKE
jgi:hypothetical protein